MRNWPLIAASSFVCLSAGAASAQSLLPPSDFEAPQIYGRDKNTSVLERSRPDYQATGLHIGGFTVFPKLEVETTYTDNLFASSGTASSFFPRVSDTSVSIRPELDISSNWGRHSLNIQAAVNNTDYVKYTSENVTAWDVRANGRLDVHGESYVDLGVDAGHAFETRGSETTQANAAHPVAYDSQTVYLRGMYAQDRVRASLDGTFANYSYYNVGEVDNSGHIIGTLNETSRDYIYWQGTGRVDYALTPDEALFVKLQPSEIRYQNAIVGQPKRDSNGFTGLIGGTFDITALARGEIGVGYVDRQYLSGLYPDISGASFAAKVEYFPTQLLTLTVLGGRKVQDASFAITSGGFFQNTVSLEADYELRRNIIVSAEGGYERDDFSGITRNDTIWNIQAKARYYLTRSFGVAASVTYIDRTSTGSPAYVGPQYDETRVGLSLVFQR